MPTQNIPFKTSDNKTLYTSDNKEYRVVETVAGAFDINLYQCSAEPPRVDKTNYLVSVATLSGTLREETSLLNPSVKIERSTLPNFNYVYIAEFGRYYFVNEVTSIRQNLWQVDLEVDVLMTYKSALLYLDGFIDRNEFKYDEKIIDKRRVIQQGYDVDTTVLKNTLFTPLLGGTFVLSGTGLFLEDYT